MSELYFFDTYACIELIRGNPAYQTFSTKKVITSIFNLAELNYILKKTLSKKQADDYVLKFSAYVIPIFTPDILLAMDLKTKNRNLSIPDAVGYTLALKNKAKFVTGDNDFRDFVDVIFLR